MKTIVTGVDLTDQVKHGVERGRFWDHHTYYLYTLLWDPFVLRCTRTVPTLRVQADPIDDPSDSVVFFSSDNTAADLPLLSEVLQQGGYVVMNHPDPDVLKQTNGPPLVDPTYANIISLREPWHLGPTAHRVYYYPHTRECEWPVEYLRLAATEGRVLSKIGGNPDLIVTDRLAVFAGNPFNVMGSYQNSPGILSKLSGDVSALLAEVVGEFSGRPLTDEDRRHIVEQFELRRDFHSFGFAYLTVRELARCMDQDQIDLSQSEAAVIEAADALAGGNIPQAERQLASAFEQLEKKNRPLQPVPAVFTDTLHGGELYPDIGYFEIDWPDHPAEVMRDYLHWARTRSYRYNVDLGATTVRELAVRYPDLFEDLKRAHDEGLVEFVNGSCNQPYPPFHSLESQIRQFDVGTQIWKDLFGSKVRTYASQEFGFCPQLASVLAQKEYDQVVIRVQNAGDAPTLRDEQIEWTAPNGDRIRSLPSHPHKSEQLNGYTYNDLHLKLYLHQRDNLDFAVFSCLGDISFHRPMREELARGCHYAPVFGRFETFSGYFDKTRQKTAPAVRLRMEEFDCDASFINLEKWPVYKDYTGNYNSNCMRSQAATHLFSAAELLDAVAASHGDAPNPAVNHDEHWEALTHDQGHGPYIVPAYASGGFLGLGDSPSQRAAKRGVSNISEYIGPIDARPVERVTDRLRSEAEKRARRAIRERLPTLATGNGAAGGFLVYSPAPARPRLVRIPGAAGSQFALEGTARPGQDDGPDRLVLLDLAAYSCTALVPVNSGPENGAPDSVVVGADYLENGQVRVEFDAATAMIRRLIRKPDGKDLLAANSHCFYFPGSRQPRCRTTRSVLSGPLRGAIEFEVEVPVANDESCVLTVTASLDAGQPVVDFETRVGQLPSPSGNQWKNHFGVRFELADPAPTIFTSQYNALEEYGKPKLFSANLLLAKGQGADVAFFNKGNEFYVRDGSAISNILIMENEPARRFRYAIGTGQRNPLIQARARDQPKPLSVYWRPTAFTP